MATRRTTRKTAGGRKRDTLVVASKIKAYVKSRRMSTSADAIAELSSRVYCMLDEATSRTKTNGRKTLKPHDI